MTKSKGLTFSVLFVFISLSIANGLLNKPIKESLTRDDELAKRLTATAVKIFNSQNSNFNVWKLEKVISVKKSGKKYNLKFMITRTDCLKEIDNQNIDLCLVRDDAPIQSCRFDIMIQSGLDGNTEEFVNKGCHNVNPKIRKSKKLDNQELEEQSEESSSVNMTQIMEKTQQGIKPNELKTWQAFSTFVTKYSKVYTSKQVAFKRFQAYKLNLRLIDMWQKNEQGTAVYGETEFMDLTSEEFRNIYLPYVWQKPDFPVKQLNGSSSEFDIEDDEVPSSFDWRPKGVVTDVKNQQSCGSCWAFSVTGNIEGQWALKKEKLVSLSEQELVDCDVIDQGCNGGLPLNAYKEIIRMGGLEPEEDYPYDAHRQTCHLVRTEIAVYINDSVQLPQDESKMQIWLFKNGPISIGINANPLQFYRHGISHPWKIFCSPMMLNHGVLIVGYGEEKNKPFWIIKNSWGPKWGEHGYYRLYRGKNVCGVNEMATSSIIY